jgi:hypothetical protein
MRELRGSQAHYAQSRIDQIFILGALSLSRSVWRIARFVVDPPTFT